ncbi:hypothetical protein BpOF4_20354 (plasmid) [Alkalihalophilus pseudofirmus OF4]|uniref:Uncharacterized protein n=1 Tax=Alkalihalophilus pseudofirmus (strain ATCC BAA-2126 / JCM 17055 / OF4) TaxID=398511 RepID=D3G142_ALKPO|nr:hypothetical protein BpOF4_20354 [Alkalihalophilus pseudofirmus OF4]
MLQMLVIVLIFDCKLVLFSLDPMYSPSFVDISSSLSEQAVTNPKRTKPPIDNITLFFTVLLPQCKLNHLTQRLVIDDFKSYDELKL